MLVLRGRNNLITLSHSNFVHKRWIKFKQGIHCTAAAAVTAYSSALPMSARTSRDKDQREAERAVRPVLRTCVGMWRVPAATLHRPPPRMRDRLQECDLTGMDMARR